MPAERIAPGNAIVADHGARVETADDLSTVLDLRRPDETMTEALERNGARRDVSVDLDPPG